MAVAEDLSVVNELRGLIAILARHPNSSWTSPLLRYELFTDWAYWIGNIFLILLR